KINKVGFKLNFYVFPAIYVQMNEIYMISRKEKIIVHSFGLFVNFTFINLVQIINEFTVNNVSLTIAFMLFSSTMIWNLIPMLNSDGYKVLLAILYLDEYNNFIKNHWLVLSIQILGVLIALNTLIHWIKYWLKYLI
ncbi:peptidase, partial [Staphylococcus kloosii]|nr:peptidase [Staphylococcus kloosii]